MKLSVRIDARFTESYVASIELGEIYKRCFAPLKTTDTPEMTYVANETLVGSREYQVILKRREDAAGYLAKHLTKMLLDAMEVNDTYNGYGKRDKRMTFTF